MTAKKYALSGCQCGLCTVWMAPETWCGPARHHAIVEDLHAALTVLGVDTSESRDLLVLGRQVRLAAEAQKGATP
jgi:hypothetical protein